MDDARALRRAPHSVPSDGVSLAKHGDSAFGADLWRNVIEVEQLDRQWRRITSSDGVVCEVSALRPRALQARDSAKS